MNNGFPMLVRVCPRPSASHVALYCTDQLFLSSATLAEVGRALVWHTELGVVSMTDLCFQSMWQILCFPYQACETHTSELHFTFQVPNSMYQQASRSDLFQLWSAFPLTSVTTASVSFAASSSSPSSKCWRALGLSPCVTHSAPWLSTTPLCMNSSFLSPSPTGLLNFGPQYPNTWLTFLLGYLKDIAKWKCLKKRKESLIPPNLYLS